jgi:RNA polymerase sigma factor (sigma-70 family)
MTDITARNKFIEAHYRQNSEHLVRHLYPKLGWHNAEDAVQEGYARALEFFESFDEEQGSFDTWFGSVLNSAVSSVLRKQPQESSLNEAMGATIPSAEKAYEFNELMRKLREQKPGKQRIIGLTLILGYAYENVAVITGKSLNVVKKTVQRFRELVT